MPREPGAALGDEAGGARGEGLRPSGLVHHCRSLSWQIVKDAFRLLA
jgi:hypothetical protein